MDLSIIIVNWNSKEFLSNCIDSILEKTKGVDYEIIVIDGGSFDGCDEMIRLHYPQVRFFQSMQNLGFSKSNNQAFRMSEGRYLLFLNPDTNIQNDAIQILVYELGSLKDAGVVGAKLLNSDRTIQTSCVRCFPNIINQMFESEVLRKWIPKSPLWGMAPLFSESENSVEVDAVSGACLMIKRSIFKDIGMFSQEYFMYSEDIDLCYKVKQKGLKIYHIPKASVIHHGGTSSSKSNANSFSDVMVLESRFRFFQKTQSKWYAILYRVAMCSASIIRIGLALFIYFVYCLCGRKPQLYGTIKKWAARLRWTLGGESWVKKY